MSRTWWVLAVSLGCSAGALAQEPPRSRGNDYSPYEEQALRSAEHALGSKRDEAPEGKLIEAVVIRRLEPIESRDPAPLALNTLHVGSRESTIARELVMQPGERFAHAQCEESARRLRTLPPFSLVLCAPLRGRDAEHVRVLILTKDVWSLFIDPDFDLSGGHLLLEPKEKNLLGLHHATFVRYELFPGSYSWGANYTIPRLDGRFLSVLADVNLILERSSSKLEGSYGAFQAQGVTSSSRDPWSWFMDLNWREDVKRTYDSGRLRRTPIDWVWHHSELNATAALIRSYGWRFKTDLTLGIASSKAGDRLPDISDTLEPSERRTLEESRRQFEVDQLTAKHRRLGPVAELRLYTSDFLRTFEVETLGLQEDFRLGHDVLLRLTPALERAPPIGSFRGREQDRLLLGASLTAQHTLALGNGFARAGAQGALDVQGARVQSPVVKGWLRLVSPRLGFGRLVQDAEATLALDASLTRDRIRYGNSDRLRGYPGGHLAGTSAGVFNLEYRTPALQLATEQLGGVLFYDAAVARRPDDQVVILDSLGLGLRIVTPILERAGLRFDFAIPLRRVCADPGCRAPGSVGARGLDAWTLQIEFGQAFGVPDVAPLKPKRLP